MEAIEDSDNDALMEEEEDDSDFDYDEDTKQNNTQQSNISYLISLGSTNSPNAKKKLGRPFGITKKKNKHEIATTRTRSGGGRGVGRGGG